MKTRINPDTNGSYNNSIPIDGSPSVRQKNIEQAARQILLNIGEDPERDGLKRTPERIARMYDELTAGYTIDPKTLINDALFEVDYNELIVVKAIEFFSLCEHHTLPFFGKAHVGYIPNGQVLGLSKIPRIVDMFARRLQVQERLTRQIADFLDELLQPQGVAVVVEGMHLCSMMRGVKQSEAKMVTQTLKGLFQTESPMRQDFMRHVGLVGGGW